MYVRKRTFYHFWWSFAGGRIQSLPLIVCCDPWMFCAFQGSLPRVSRLNDIGFQDARSSLEKVTIDGLAAAVDVDVDCPSWL